MAHVMAQVRFRRQSNKPEDVVINTFHFDLDDLVDGPQGIADNLVNFYVAAHAGQQPLVQLLSPVLANSGHVVRLYDMTGPPPHQPILEVPWVFPLSPLSSNPLPSEVALCLSFRSLTGALARRSRGRVYIGPLGDFKVLEASAGDVRPTSAVMGSVLAAGVFLRDVGGPGLWCVWSETDQQLRPVTNVHVDNAFDTQRRRGAASTSRLINP